MHWLLWLIPTAIISPIVIYLVNRPAKSDWRRLPTITELRLLAERRALRERLAAEYPEIFEADDSGERLRRRCRAIVSNGHETAPRTFDELAAIDARSAALDAAAKGR